MSASESNAYQQSRPQTVSPFGHIPTESAGRFLGGFAKPFTTGIGHENVRALSAANVPVLQQLVPQAMALSKKLMGTAEGSYSGYQSSIDQFLSQLPGFQNALNQGYAGVGGPGGTDEQAVKYAQQAAGQAFDPTQYNALFQNSAQQALSAARTTEAARGMLDSGAAGASEQQNILTPLANQFMQQRFGNEQAATQLLSGAGTQKLANAAQYAQAGAGLAGMAPQARAALFQAMPSLIQSLVTSMGLPMGAAGQILQYLTGSFQPLLGLAATTAPTVAQRSFGMSQSSSAGA